MEELEHMRTDTSLILGREISIDELMQLAVIKYSELVTERNRGSEIFFQRVDGTRMQIFATADSG